MKGIILAGGKSSRMGRNKALLPYKKGRLIDHMASLLKQAGITSLYVSGIVEGFDCIPDVLPNIGPVGGVYSTLQYFGLSSQRYLFIPVDMPLLPIMALQQLMVYPDSLSVYFNHYFLPMLLQDSRLLRDYLALKLVEPVETIHCSIKEVLRETHAKALELSDQEKPYFMNVNTADMWLRLKNH